ncbi:riboflavin kinase-like [Saccostrea cucullata]|uniref:riboflavin kinase-like n=1 Tax=Saccostrea cuccullata TaxID=36930 RepID=UPI002ED2B67D
MRITTYTTFLRRAVHTVMSMKLPHFAEGEVVKGFGRGSKELGIPTANFPESVVEELPPGMPLGVYYGWGNVDDGEVYKMVLSVGWNLYYKNTKKSMETYLMHTFNEDFYGSKLKVIMLGYIRPMKDFSSLDELIQAIENDIYIAKEKLDQPDNLVYKTNNFFSPSGCIQNGSVETSEPVKEDGPSQSNT